MAETMTSRERVIKTLNHGIPDRVPIDLGMNSATGISGFAYWNLCRHLNLSTDAIELYHSVMLLARVEEEVLKRVHSDCILLEPRAPRLRRWNPRGNYVFNIPSYMEPQKNEKGEWILTKGNLKMRMPEDGYFFDGDWIAYGDPFEDKAFKSLTAEAERIYKETDKFTSFKGFYPFYRQDMDYFCDMITEPERLMEENEYQLKEQLKNAGRFVKAMKNYAGAVCLGGDLGGQDTPMCRPESFEKIVMPYLKVFTDFIHRNSDMKIFLHTCGAVEPLIPLLIESGIDILNPVQISAKGMEPRVLKQKYGKDIVFWGGGADTQTVLGMKPGSAVAENVRYLMNCFKPGGGYVFTPVHNIMGNIRPEDILTVYDTAYREGFY